MLVCATTTIIAHETAGASGARHSPRPLFGEGGKLIANLGQSVPRDREGVFACHCAPTDRANGRPLTGAARNPAVGWAKAHFAPCPPSLDSPCCWMVGTLALCPPYVSTPQPFAIHAPGC